MSYLASFGSLRNPLTSNIESIMRVLVDELLLSNESNPDVFRRICLNSATTTNKVIRFLLVHLSQRFLDGLEPQGPSTDTFVSEAAGLINAVVHGDEYRKKVLVDWCTASSGAGLGHQTAIRRAVLSVLALDKETIIEVFEKSLSQFGDELYIKHAATMQQNGEWYCYTLRFPSLLTRGPSPCRSPAFEFGLRLTLIASEAGDDLTIWSIPNRYIKSNCIYPDTPAISRNGGWRMFVNPG